MHDRMTLLLLALLATSGLGAIIYILLTTYKRRLLQARTAADSVGDRQRGARWLAGRWDRDERHAYVANFGDDIAYDVTVIENHRVIATAHNVPPYSADRLTSTSETPCYLTFCIHRTPQSRTRPNAIGSAHPTPPSAESVSIDGVDVEVIWRNVQGGWSTRAIHADQRHVFLNRGHRRPPRV